MKVKELLEVLRNADQEDEIAEIKLDTSKDGHISTCITVKPFIKKAFVSESVLHLQSSSHDDFAGTGR